MSGASSAGKTYSREKRVHGLKPSPISASSAPVRYLMRLVLPLCVLPKSQKNGTGVWPRSPVSRSCNSSSRGADENQRFKVLNMPLPFYIESISAKRQSHAEEQDLRNYANSPTRRVSGGFTHVPASPRSGFGLVHPLPPLGPSLTLNRALNPLPTLNLTPTLTPSGAPQSSPAPQRHPRSLGLDSPPPMG